MDCYGRSYGKREDCQACECAVYCKDAADLPAGSHRSFDETRIEGETEIPEPVQEPDIEAFETEWKEEEDMAELPQKLKEAFVMLSAIADGSETRLGIIIDRIAGKSYEWIAKKRGMSKQAVEKHMRVIRKQNLELYKYLLGAGPRMPIQAIETGTQLGFVDSDRVPARKSRPGSRKRREEEIQPSLL